MRVFLSFNFKDTALAEMLRAGIQKLEPSAEIFFSPVSLGQGFWLPKLADGIQEADCFLLLLGPKGVGPWQEVEYHEAFDRHVRDSRFAMVPVIAHTGQAPGLPFLRQLNWIEAPSLADDAKMARILGALKGEAGPSAAALWKLVHPYRGLEAMTEANADYFFGRARQTEAVLDVLARKPGRMPLLIGASGTGKSSIAQAGVLSALKSMRWPGSSQDGAAAVEWPAAFRNSRNSWAWLVVRPGEQPLTALASAFTRLWVSDPRDPQRGPIARMWAEGLRQGNTLGDLIDATQEALEAREGMRPERILLYIDQGEELYTRAARTAPQEARRFSELLGLGLADPRLAVFGSLRADYFDRLQADEQLFSRYEHINVPPLSRADLEEVVRGPAAALGARFEDEYVAQRIASAATSEPGALPLLSYLLTDMWSGMVARNDGVLRLPVHAIDVGGVLTSRAEEFLKLHPAAEPQLKRLLTLRLVLVPSEGAPVRRQAPRNECTAEEWALAEQLADHPWRLVVASERDAEVVAEVAHESLLSAWPRLAGWIRDERDFLVFKGEAERLERRWLEADKASEALLTGLDLARASAWLPKRADDLSGPVRGFIATSIDAEREAREKQLRQAQALAQARKQTVRRTMVGLAAALVLAILAGWKWREADQQTEVAKAAQQRAQQTLALATGTATTLVFDLAQQFKDTVGIPQTVVRDILERSRRLLDQLPLESGAPVEVQRTRATALNETAKSLLQAGEIAAARSAATASLAIFEGIAASDRGPDRGPDAQNLDARYNVSLGQELLASIEADDGQAAAAIKLLKTSLDARVRIVAQRSQDIDWQVGLALAHDNLAKLLHGDEQIDAALDNYTKALSIRTALAAHDPQRPDWQGALALSFEHVGTIKVSKGKPDEARDHFLRALELREKLADAQSDQATPQRDLAFCLELLGDLELADGSAASAFDFYHKSLEVRDKLAQSDPAQQYWQRDLILTLTSVANAQVKLGEGDRALATFRTALELQEKLANTVEAAETASGQGARNGTVSALGNLAWHAVLARQFDKAVTAADRALRIAPEREWISLNRAHALLFLGRVDDARKAYLANREQKTMTVSRVPQKASLEGDFDDLRKAGLDHPEFKAILAAAQRPN